MKRKIIFLIVFAITCFSLNAYTKKEMIQEELSKKGIKQEIINETIEIDKGIGFNLLYENEEHVRKDIQNLKKILEKDKRNFVIMDKLLLLYSLYLKDDKDYKKYVDLYSKNVPYESEKTTIYVLYYKSIGNEKKAREYFEEIKKKNMNNTEYYIAKSIIDSDLEAYKKAFELLKSEKIKREYGVTDEGHRQMELSILKNELVELLQKENYEGAVDYYLNKIYKNNLSEDVYQYNLLDEMGLLSTIIQINNTYVKNNTIQKKNKEKLDKVSSEFIKKVINMKDIKIINQN